MVWQPETVDGTPVAPALWQPPVVDRAAITPATVPGGALANAPKLTGVRINVRAPDGTAYSVDEAELGAVQEKGWRPETATERDVREYVDENKGIGGAAKVFFRGLADEAAFGVLDPILDHTADPLERSKWEAVKKEHAAANVVGRAAGFGASMLYGGEFAKGAGLVGKAAERAVLFGGERAAEGAAVKAVSAETYRVLAGAVESKMLTAGVPAVEAAVAAPGFARKLVANGAKYGAESMAFVAPKALTEAALGDPEQAGETIVSALGVGALLGLAGGVAGAGWRAVTVGAAKGLPGVETAAGGGVRSFLDKTADEQAFKSLASNQASLKKAAREALHIEGGQAGIGRTLRDEGLVRRVGEDVEEYAVRVAEAKAAAGAEVGGMYKKLDELGADTGLSVQALGKKMRDDVLKPLQGKPGFESVAAKVEAYISSFEEKGAAGGWTFAGKDSVSFERLHSVRASLDDLVYRNAGAAPAEHIKELRDIRKMIQRDLVEKGETQAQKFGQEFAAPLKAANIKYARLTAAEKAAADFAEVRKLTNRSLSPTDYGVGGIGAVGGMLANPLGVLGGVGAALAHKFVREEGNAIAARTLGAVSSGSGLVLAEQAMKRTAERLDSLPLALMAMSSPAGRAAAKDTLGTNILSRFVDADPSFRRSDKATQVTILADRLASLAASPGEMQKHIEELTGGLVDDAPGVATQAGAKAAALIHHLHAVAPKAPAVSSVYAAQSPWKPSPKQVSEFEQRLAMAVDPMSAIDRLRARAITPGEVDTLRTLYPKLYARMVGKIAEATANGKAPTLAYGDRAVLGRFLGSPVDRSLSPKRIRGYQQTFLTPEANAGPGGGGSGGGGGKPMKMPSMETPSDRIASR